SQREPFEVAHGITLYVTAGIFRVRAGGLFEHRQGGELDHLSQVESGDVSDSVAYHTCLPFCRSPVPSQEPAAVGSRRPSSTLHKGEESTRHGVELPGKGGTPISLSPPGRQGDGQDEIIVIPLAPGTERLLGGRGNSYTEGPHFLDEQPAFGQ